MSAAKNAGRSTDPAGRDLAAGEGADPTTTRLLQLTALASAPRAVDPMDKAVHARAPAAFEAMGMDGDAVPERTWPLRAELLAVVQRWRAPGDAAIAAAKGAPEAIFRLCRPREPDHEQLLAIVSRYADQGLRVLGAASAVSESALGEEPLDFDFEFAGLLGFLDPLRGDVRNALAEAAAGVTVVMITRDHPATATAIVRAAGIDTAAGALTGAELAALAFDELRERLRSVRVFACIVPDQKLRILEALNADGEVVAVTGDGMNDAPALEAAHIGIAMGRRGTDVAREAADLVLLNDSFASIVSGVRGRRIFANLRRALTYITAIHVPIAGLAPGLVLLGAPPLLYPSHVAPLELVIDPTCSLVFEAEPSAADAMRKPPRRRDEGLFGPGQILLGLLQGATMLAAVLGLYLLALHQTSLRRSWRSPGWAACSRILPPGPGRLAIGLVVATVSAGWMTLLWVHSAAELAERRRQRRHHAAAPGARSPFRS